MGARGPLKVVSHLTPVTTATKGTAAADAPAMAPTKPKAVMDDADLSRLWDEIVPGLDAAGLLAPSDAAAVELCLRHFLTSRQAHNELADVVVEDSAHGGVKKNPAEAVFRAESEMFLKYAQQLGMTFVSRARTPAAKGGADDGGNPFQQTGG